MNNCDKTVGDLKRLQKLDIMPKKQGIKQ